MLKNWFKTRKTKKKLNELQDAIKTCESMGYSVVNMYEIAGSMYIRDMKGTQYALKSQDKKRGKKS